jgi:hypothetical protein
MTPLWLCLKIQPCKERKAHELFRARGFTSLYAHKIVERPAHRHRSKTTVQFERPLLTGYALVAHDGEPQFVERLHALCWLYSDLPVIKDVLGRVPLADVLRLEAISGKADEPPAPKLFAPGEAARFNDSHLLRGLQCRIKVIRGNTVRVEIGGREVITTADKLEAAA